LISFVADAMGDPRAGDDCSPLNELFSLGADLKCRLPLEDEIDLVLIGMAMDPLELSRK